MIIIVQVPTEPSIVVFISPLTSLMIDQQRKFAPSDLDAENMLEKLRIILLIKSE